MSKRPALEPDSPPITRRSLFGRAAAAAATLVVSQSVLGCAASDAVAAGDPTTIVPAGSANSSCVLTAALTEGPYFVDEKLNRSDIRVDAATGTVSAGIPLVLTFNVARVGTGGCTPLTGAFLDVWHCDAAGVYSDVSGSGSGHKFLRGYQMTDANGAARFTTVYPGWYSGRAVHIHFKLRQFAGGTFGGTQQYEFTSQFFMEEAITDAVHALAPYSSKGTRNVRNTADGIYNGLSSAAKSALTLQTTESPDGYNGVINLDVNFA